MRQGWGSRLVRVEQAQGILVAALGGLGGMATVGSNEYLAFALQSLPTKAFALLLGYGARCRRRKPTPAE